MLRRSDYPSHDDMIQIDWHHSGVFSNPAGVSRSAYLGGSAAPDVFFDGVDHVLGAGDSLSSYSTYRTIVHNHYQNQGSQLILQDAHFDLNLGTGSSSAASPRRGTRGGTTSDARSAL
jgi:hypothetical protein